jgi:transposase
MPSPPQSASGGEQIGYDAGKRVRGLKRHILVDTSGLLPICVAHSASIQDRTGAKLVLSWIGQQYPSIELIWSDHGLGVRREIVKRSGDVKGLQVLPRRWVVGRSLGWLARCRRLCRDYERTIAHAEDLIKSR